MPFNNKLRKNIASNILRSLIGGVILFAIFRYLNLTLGIDDFGIWTTVIAISTLLRLASLGLAQALLRQISINLISGKKKLAIFYIETTLTTILLIYLACFPLLKIGIDFGIDRTFTGDDKEKAISIALLTIYLVIISEIGMVFHSIIEGFQRMEVNALISIFGQLTMLMCVLVLVPEHGLKGVLFAQIAQAIFILVFSWLWIKKQLPKLPLIPKIWSIKILKSMLGYGCNISLTNACAFLMDPITKIFLTKMGGPSLSAYFELASQFIQRFRGILLTANSAVIPKIAELTKYNQDDIKEIYNENLKIALILSMAVYSVLLASSDLLSILMFKDIKPTFINMITILTIGWLINALAASAYFSNLGTGKVGINTISQIFMGILNLILCLLLGNELNGMGVTVSYATAVTLSSVSLYIYYQKNMNIPWSIFINNQEIRLFSYLLITFIFSLVTNYIFNYDQIIYKVLKFLVISLVELILIYNFYLFYKINKYYKHF
jgi:O-antigen/teichoic acid export membrane protein